MQEHAVKAFQRFARTAKLQKRHAAPVKQLSVIGRKAQAFIVACERALKISQRVKNQAQAGKAVGARKVAFQRCLSKRQRRIEPPALVVDLPKALQCVEIVGLMLHQLGVNPLRFVKLTFFESLVRAPEHPRQIRL